MPTGAQAAANPVRPISRNLSFVINVAVILVLMVDALGAQSDDSLSSEALLKFKSSLANADPVLSNWDSTKAPPCSGDRPNWNGILCFGGSVWGLQLENMNLKGRIDVNALVTIRFLRTVSFMNNGFEGTMPDWRKLGALKALYLSHNQFSGDIPHDAFKGMNSLKKVHMANNKFMGLIPSSLESPKLIELRLENNQFTGTIPAISSDYLKTFNVSNNRLEGPIPAHLTTLDASSFSGNKALCGKPLGSGCDTPILPPDSEPSQPAPPGAPLNGGANEKKSSMYPARIAIIVICALLGMFMILLLLLICLRSHKSRATPAEGEVMPTTSDEKGVSVEAPAAHLEGGGGGGGRKGEQQAGKLMFVREEREKFDLQDLMRASAEVLGSGNFGASYKAVLMDGEALVVKRFKQMNHVAREDFHEHMRRLGRLAHPNLLPLVAYLYRKEEKLFIFDYVYNGSLATHLHGKHSAEHPGLNWASRLRIIKGVAKGLAYLHSELLSLIIPHGHLKSSNVLLDNNFNPLLMDYTLGPVVNPSHVHQILVAYKSPEYSHTGRTHKKTDIWCMGILILEILTGTFLANYQAQGSGHYGADLAGWINAIVGQVNNNPAQAFDKEMQISSERCRPEMEKLLQIGIACCQEEVDKRLDLEEALNQIEQVHEES